MTLSIACAILGLACGIVVAVYVIVFDLTSLPLVSYLSTVTVTSAAEKTSLSTGASVTINCVSELSFFICFISPSNALASSRSLREHSILELSSSSLKFTCALDEKVLI